MNYKQAIKAIIAIIVTASFAACTDYSEFSEAELKHQEDLKSYTEMFKAMFGEFDPNHTWGMEEQIRCMQSVGGSMIGTRAGADDHGHVDVNVNQWVDHNNVAGGTYAGPYDATALAHDIKIPGWPHLNDLYYGSTSGSSLDFAAIAGNIPNGARPCGDVTEYEIQYVSTWFRTHKNPRSIDLHLSDFFIQNVCADADQVEYTNTQPSTDTKGIAPQKNGANIEFATQGVGRNITIKSQGSNERINYSLDQLCFKAIGGSENPNINSDGWTHANNFNNGNVNFDPENHTENKYREIKYITSSGTEDFACRSSMYSASGDKPWLYGKEKSWVLVHLQWVETVKDPNSPKKGQEIPREGYYLAFDFETETPQTKVERDGYYSNWIIKITPGHFTPESGAKRVMCEDLGGALDFDFNDAVFDVAFDKNGQTIVTVQATGATMPIYIGWDPRDTDKKYNPTSLVSQYEIHNLLDNVSGTMKQINVKDDVFATHAPAIFRGRIYDKQEDRVLSNLEMYVVNTREGNTVYQLNSNKYDRAGIDDPQDAPDAEGATHKDIEDKSIAPRAFAIPATEPWMVEYVSIDKAYTDFNKWCKNPSAGSSTSDPWYKTLASDVNGKLYSHEIDKNGLIHGQGGGTPKEWLQLTPPDDAPTITNVSSIMKLKAYDGETAIWRTITANKLSDDHQITFTVEMQSATKLNDEDFTCSLIPANYNSETQMISYGNYSAQASEFPSAIDMWKQSTRRDDIDGDKSPYVYTISFNFTVKQLRQGQANTDNTFDEEFTNGFADYLLFYLKKDNGYAPSGITINRWFAHY